MKIAVNNEDCELMYFAGRCRDPNPVQFCAPSSLVGFGALPEALCRGA